MSVWDLYDSRMMVGGTDRRSTILKREKRMLEAKSVDTLSYQTVSINGCCRDVSIINSDNLNEKTIIAQPGESVIAGDIVYWMDNNWLITEVDANTTVYQRGKMIQCNHLLKWVSDGEIFEQWCIVEDGTKYLTGELEDRNFVVTRGDSRVAITVPRNEHTVKLDRENRFLIDDPESPHKLAYILSKPLKAGLSYSSGGVFKFVLQEVTATKFDNHELGIADYYKYFEKEIYEDNVSGKEVYDVKTDNTNRKEWL